MNHIATISSITGAITGVFILLGFLFRIARRVTQFLDDWNGVDRKNGGRPPAMARLESLEKLAGQNNEMLQHHLATDVPQMAAQGEAWGHRLEDRIAALEEHKGAGPPRNPPGGFR